MKNTKLKVRLIKQEIVLVLVILYRIVCCKKIYKKIELGHHCVVEIEINFIFFI